MVYQRHVSRWERLERLLDDNSDADAGARPRSRTLGAFTELWLVVLAVPLAAATLRGPLSGAAWDTPLLRRKAAVDAENARTREEERRKPYVIFLVASGVVRRGEDLDGRRETAALARAA